MTTARDAMTPDLPASLDQLPTPALLVDVDQLGRNVATMASRYREAGVALRPHVKTSKCWEVARRQLDAGAIGFTCSTPAEVAWLQEHGVRDLLWAHHPVGPRKIDFAVAAAAAGGLTVALDSPELARPLSDAAAAAGVEIPFALEVDTGHARAGVDPADAVERATAITALPALRLRGVFTHEGHLATQSDTGQRESLGRSTGARLVQVADELRAAGHDVELVSVGSTPGASSTPFAPGVTEARPGTYVYFDANQTRLGSCTFDECAQTVLARVVSTQRPTRVIIDAGLKAMSSDTIAAAGSLGIACTPDGRALPDVVFADGNEEHGFLIGEGARALRPGDLVRIVPNHACGTENMWSHLYAVHGTQAVADWPIAARH